MNHEETEHIKEIMDLKFEHQTIVMKKAIKDAVCDSIYNCDVRMQWLGDPKNPDRQSYKDKVDDIYGLIKSARRFIMAILVGVFIFVSTYVIQALLG